MNSTARFSTLLIVALRFVSLVNGQQCNEAPAEPGDNCIYSPSLEESTTCQIAGVSGDAISVVDIQNANNTVNVVGLDPGLQCSVSILRRLKNFVKIKFQGSECPTFSNILVDRLACQSDPATFRIYRDIQNAQDDLSITSSGDSTVYTFSGLSSIADPCREKFIDDVQFCLVSETAIF
mmetsp:Transcript_28457/g.39607  ORF Transcript_28457/g.39607 Transcript_28457/m.39607 type:complete len:179 (-) Transcript_28457:904-1440(-)